MVYDAVVIGAGVVGTAVARVLSQFEGRIAIIEKSADVSMGASKANSGIVHAGYDAAPGTKKAHYNVRGAELMPKLCAELGVKYAACGALVIAFAPEERETLHGLLKQGEANGVCGLEIIEKEAVLALEPSLNDKVLCALHVPTSGIVSPYELTYALADNAIQNGASLSLETMVTGIEKTGEGYLVLTDKGSFLTRAVVNCAGMGAAKIHGMICADDVTVIPRRGEYYLIDRTDSLPFKKTIFQCPTKMGKGVLVSPTVHGNTLLGPNAEDVDDFENTETTEGALAEILEKSRLTWPQLSLRTNITTFAGIRTHEQKGDFIINESLPLFFEALGIESPGLTSAPAIGEEWGREIAEKCGLTKKKTLPPPFKIPKPFADMSFAERQSACEGDKRYGAIVCRCECVTEAEIVLAVNRPCGARNVDGIKRRTRAGMGRCQGGFCSPRVMEILARELNVSELAITKCGGESRILVSKIGEAAQGEG